MAEQIYRGLVVKVGCCDFVCALAEYFSFSLEGDFGSPENVISFFTLVNAFESAGVIFQQSRVGHVLRLCGVAKIGGQVVESVSVFVVSLQTRFWWENDLMKHSHLAVNSSSSVESF